MGFSDLGNTLIIGAGQTGIRIASMFRDKYNYDKKNVLLFNTNPDDDIKGVTLLHTKNRIDGSGRNPQYTLETIIPQNEIELRDTVEKQLRDNDIGSVILFNSLSGGSGSAINYFIASEILIPFKANIAKTFDIVSVVINPFSYEGNPAVSNSMAMLNMYFSLTKDISIIPIENDIAYKESKGANTFEATNDLISDIVFKTINYDYFLGKPKTEGLGTLDRKEMSRIVEPANGFLAWSKVDIKDLKKISNPLNSFNVATAKKMIVMIRTPQSQSIDLKILERFNNEYPSILKIYAESESENENIEIEMIANGINIPESHVKKVNETVENIQNLKTMKKEDKKTNKQTVKVSKNKMFNI